jgi:hypothetical protein
VLDYRYYYLSNLEKNLMKELSVNEGHYQEIMKEYMRIKRLYGEVAKKLGRG